MHSAEHWVAGSHALTRILLAPVTLKVVSLAVGTLERNLVDGLGAHGLLSFYLVCYLYYTDSIGSVKPERPFLGNELVTVYLDISGRTMTNRTFFTYHASSLLEQV